MGKEERIKKIEQYIKNEQAAFYYIILTMIIVPIAELITEFFGCSFENQSRIISFSGVIGFILFIVHISDNVKTNRLFISDVFIILLNVFMIISLIFSKDIIESLTGKYYDELFTHFWAYYSLAFAGTRINDEMLRKKILYVFCFVAIINGVVALFQTFGLQIDDCFFGPLKADKARIAYGLTQNSNFFGGLCIPFVGAAAGLYLFSRDKVKRIIFLCIASLIFYLSLCSQARLAWVGNIGIIGFYIVSFIVSKKKFKDKKEFRSIICRFIFLIMVFMVCILMANFCNDALSLGLRKFSYELGNDFDNMGSHRGYIWRYGIQSVPANWLFGVGLDNYKYAFTSNPNWHEGMYYQSKGHNEYLHLMVTQGVPALLNYLAMLIYIISAGVKNVIKNIGENKSYITWIYLGMVTGYMAQAIFNSSVINVAIYFWIALGLVLPDKEQKIIKRIC